MSYCKAKVKKYCPLIGYKEVTCAVMRDIQQDLVDTHVDIIWEYSSTSFWDIFIHVVPTMESSFWGTFKLDVHIALFGQYLAWPFGGRLTLPFWETFRVTRDVIIGNQKIIAPIPCPTLKRMRTSSHALMKKKNPEIWKISILLAGLWMTCLC